MQSRNARHTVADNGGSFASVSPERLHPCPRRNPITEAPAHIVFAFRHVLEEIPLRRPVTPVDPGEGTEISPVFVAHNRVIEDCELTVKDSAKPPAQFRVLS